MKEKVFIDENVDVEKVVFESDNNIELKLREGHYKLAEGIRPKVKRKKILSDIGPKSEGFAGIFTLAMIVAIAGVIIGFIVLSF